MSNTKLIVIYDTYCGWCYGAAPIFDALADADIEIEALHRHLFQGEMAYKMSEGKGDLVMQADAQIAQLTGQKFSPTYVANVVMSKTEILESSYSAQAAALVHDLGIKTEFAVRRRLEKARFIEGISASNREAVVSALVAEGLERDLAETIGSTDLVEQAAKTSQRAASIMAEVGSNGVPTILKVVNDHYERVDHAAFYGKPTDIIEWITQRTETSTQAS